MDTITIQGHPFQVDAPYEEGHELNANEAAAMNQLRHENLRNNFASKVRAAIEDAGDPSRVDWSALQSQFDQYAAAYAFGTRVGGGGGPRDPVHTEAMNIARQVIRNAIRAKGGKVNQYEASAINEAAKKLLDSAQGSTIRSEAEERVRKSQAVAQTGLGDILAGLTTAKSDQSAAA